MKKLVAFVLAAILLLSLAACGTQPTADDGSNAGRIDASTPNKSGNADSAKNTNLATTADVKTNFDVGINSDLGDVSPFGSSSTGRTYTKYAIYENLLQFGSFGQTVEEMERMLAKEVNVIDDMTCEIVLYDYIFDAAGNHITADDVKWCYEMCAESGNYAKLTTNMESLEVTGDYTLLFKFNKAEVGVMEYVLGQVPIVSKAAYEADENGMLNAPVSTAPYQVKEISAGEYMILERNPNYWQTDESLRTHFATMEFDQITLHVIKEDSQMSIGLQTGVIDAATSVSGSEIARFQDENGEAIDGYNIMSQYGGLTTWLGLNNTKNSPLSNHDLRMAVMHAINVDDIVLGALNGQGRAVGTLGTPTSPDYKEEWEEDYFNFDMDLAKQYFAASGYKSGEVTLRIMTQNTSAHNKAAEIIQAYLGQLGIKCEILAYDSALFNTYKGDPTQWDIKIDQSGTSDFVVSSMYTCMSSGGMNKWFTDDKVEQLCADAMSLSTYGEETTEVLHEYLKEAAFIRGLYVVESYTVSVDCIEMVRHPWGQLMCGACHIAE